MGQSRVQSQELLVIAPAMLKCIALGSITLWKENKKSIFRALKAFLFFCGDQGGWEREDVWMLLAFLCVQDFFLFFLFPIPVLFFPFNWMHWPGPGDLLFDAITNVITKWQSPTAKRWHQTWSVMFYLHINIFIFIFGLSCFSKWSLGMTHKLFVVGILAMHFIFLSI